MSDFKIIETTVECCANCKGVGEDCERGFAWVYCKTRAENDEKFNGDCGERLGCNKYIKNL